MKFKDIEEGKLYQYKDFNNVYTKKDGLLYHMGSIYGTFNKQPTFHVDMYYCEYNPKFTLGMEFREVKLGRV